MQTERDHRRVRIAFKRKLLSLFSFPQILFSLKTFRTCLIVEFICSSQIHLHKYFIQEDSLKSQYYTSFGTISNPGQEQTKAFLSFYVAPDMKEALSVVYWTLANSNNVNPPLSGVELQLSAEK